MSNRSIINSLPEIIQPTILKKSYQRDSLNSVNRCVNIIIDCFTRNFMKKFNEQIIMTWGSRCLVNPVFIFTRSVNEFRWKLYMDFFQKYESINNFSQKPMRFVDKYCSNIIEELRRFAECVLPGFFFFEYLQ